MLSEEESLVPDSYEYSQFTQTQTQTQTQSSATPAFPSHLWGVLVSVSRPPTQDDLQKENDSNPNAEPWVDRPARLEMAYHDGNSITVGRHPSSDLHLNGKKISTKHARIFVVDGEDGVRLEDLSTNGTTVRAQKVGKGNITLLESGDEIIFGPPSGPTGGVDFRYFFQGPASAASVERTGVYAEYDVREQIGKGSFATVNKGIRRSDGKMVAIKIIMKARFASNPKTMEMIRREVEIMKALDHKYCVRYVDFFEDADRMWLVLEFVDGGDLLDYVMKRKGLKESETREIALMVCEAVAYLHSKGVAHRDLKPENLLLTKGSRPLCKVTDFGLAKMVDQNVSYDVRMRYSAELNATLADINHYRLKTCCGTPSYLAPEVILNANPATGYAVDFLSKMLLADPTKRMTVPTDPYPSSEESLEHPWLATTTNNGVSSRAAPLLVSSLPFNSGANARPADTPSLTSPAISTADSFGYSQRMNDLRLGTPHRSMASITQTTPDRTMEDEGTTEAGEHSAHEVPTPVNSNATGNRVAFAEDHSMMAVSPTVGSAKRKQLASAFSSSSSNGMMGQQRSAMDLDEAPTIAPGVPPPAPAAPESKSDAIESSSVAGDEDEEDGEGRETRSMRRSTRGTGTPAKAAATRRKAAARTSGDGEGEEMQGPTTRRRAKVARLA
ncbi:ser/thr/tyr protein kinase RAD53 [Pseudohyphozyma bogoriensis]|nr:ser/thr/tyr protein kinase RAD53 [Pseudohyphozyma bogoriensis]